MPNIEINMNTSMFKTDDDGALVIKVSNAENNGISLNGDGKLVATLGEPGSPGTGGTTNTPGNGVYGTFGKGINTARCDDTVSRRDIDVPLQSSNEISMSSIVAQIRAINNK